MFRQTRRTMRFYARSPLAVAVLCILAIAAVLTASAWLILNYLVPA